MDPQTHGRDEPSRPNQRAQGRVRASRIDLTAGSKTYRWVLGLWIVYWVALFGVMHTRQIGVPTWMPQGSDKTLHLVCYFILGWLGWWVLSAPGRPRPWRCEQWLGLLAVYAAVDETLQAVCNRFCSTGDFLADIAGGLLAVVALEAVRAAWPDPGIHLTRATA